MDHHDLRGIGNYSLSACFLLQNVNGNFCCTACHKVAAEVHPHPLLGVIICGECKMLIESKIHVQVWPTNILCVKHQLYHQDNAIKYNTSDMCMCVCWCVCVCLIFVHFIVLYFLVFKVVMYLFSFKGHMRDNIFLVLVYYFSDNK